MQSEIDFTAPYNQHEGNQAILDENREHFSGQAKWVLEQLLVGRVLTGLIASREYGIQDIRPRIAKLIAMGYPIQKGKVPGGHGAKTFYMTPDDREKNKSK